MIENQLYMSENTNMAVTRKGLRIILLGLVVMISGFILMMGGGTKLNEAFNWAMFDFRRLVAAPVVIACGVIIVIAGIVKRDTK